MKVKPLGERVLVQISAAETKTASGLYIPDTAQEKTQTGEVVAIGDDESINVKPGQKVMYDKYAGSNINIDNVDYLIIKIGDIIAIVE